MLQIEHILHSLKAVYERYDDIRVGVAGSYVNNSMTIESDLDIVLDGDSMRTDIMEYVKSLFPVPVDVLWVDLMRQEDEELDQLAKENGLPINKYSVYKTVMREVQWV